MAKKTNLNARLISLKEETDQLKANEKQLEKLFALDDKMTKAQFEKVETLQAANKVLEKSARQYELLLKLQKEKQKLIISELKDYKDMDTSLVSIGNTLGKNSKAYQFQAEKLAQTKGVLESISGVVSKNAKINDSDKDSIAKLLKAYKQNNASILEAKKLKERDKISQQEYYEIIKKSKEAYSDIRSEIELSTDAVGLLGEQIANMDSEIESSAKTAKLAGSALKGVETSIDGIAGSGVEGVRELGNVLKSAANGGKGLTMALSAAVGVLAGMAYNYGLIGDKVGTIAGYDAKIIAAQGSINETNQMLSMGKELPTYDKAGKVITGTFKAVNYVAEKAMLDFRTSVQQMGASFQAASKTALFGKNLGGVGYGAAQLQMAGISAENIAQAMQAASDATGKMPTGKVAADMSIMAQRTGQSTESIANINETFQRLDNVSEKTALNLQEGVRAMADKAGVNLGSAMAEIAEASKDALSYQIRGSSQLAKQVIAAKSIGVSFNDVAKAGKNMVLNYKDSIKAEMSLSAMLGKNVNLSEVRAKFMSGDNDGAMSSLKSLGLNPKDMNVFQQQALQDALGGLDLNSIQKITENTEKSGGNLTESNTEIANKTFLSAKQSAEAGLAASQAMIAATAQLEGIKLDTAEQVQAQIALAANVNKLATETNNKAQLEALKNAETGLTAAIIGLTFAIGTQMLGNILSKKLPGKSNPTTSPIGNSSPMRGPDGRFLPKAPATPPVKATGLLKVLPKAGALLKIIPKLATVTKGLGVVGSVLGAGVDFASRKDEGQTNTQAAAGVGGGLAGAALGAKGGAMAGAAIGAFFGGVGAAPGAIIGGLIGGGLGYFTGSSIADSLTGAGKKPAVIVPSTDGQKQIDAQNEIVEKAKVTLTETQYSTKLQQEMIAMLGLSTQILSKIMENTAGEKDITLDGKTIKGSLLNQARRNYGVARTA